MPFRTPSRPREWARTGCLALAMVALISGVPLTGAPLSRADMDQALALGRHCRAPIVHLTAGQFDVYVESPFARAALVFATAIINHRVLDDPGVTGAMTSDYRIWAVYSDMADRTVSVTRIGVQPPGRPEVGPVRERPQERLVLGVGGSHGIIEPLRLRTGEAIFDELPPGVFQVVLHTTAGAMHLSVTARERASQLRVCN